jgi:hypothetical protein
MDMTLEEIAAVIKVLAAYGIGGAVAGGVAYLFLRSYLSPYLGEKAKNLATKEDIADITHGVEAIKTQYTLVVEQLRGQQQLRMAAVDRRLQAHQEAYALWRELVAYAYEDDIGQIVVRCQAWWNQNCLYLEPAAREAFVESYSAAMNHRTYVRMEPPRNAELVKSNWQKVLRAGEAIVLGVQLPGLTSVEQKDVIDAGKPSQ